MGEAKEAEEAGRKVELIDMMIPDSVNSWAGTGTWLDRARSVTWADPLGISEIPRYLS